MANPNPVIYPVSNIAEIVSILRNVQGVTIVAGGTELARRQTGKNLRIPPLVLPLARVPELCTITKTERYLEFGPSVTLAAILQLGQKNLPEVLYEAIRSVANPGIRALGTIGGNIAAKGHRLSAFAPLLALDARLEIRSPSEALWVPMSRYFSNTGKTHRERREFISKIRVPTEHWDYASFARIGSPGLITDRTASFSFLVKLQKNILSDLRVAWGGSFFFRNREFENLLIGRTLPLQAKDLEAVEERVAEYLPDNLFPPSYERSCFFNMLRNSLRSLT